MVTARASVVFRESPPRCWNAFKLYGGYYLGDCRQQYSYHNIASTTVNNVSAVNSLSRIDANLPSMAANRLRVHAVTHCHACYSGFQHLCSTIAKHPNHNYSLWSHELQEYKSYKNTPNIM